MKSLGVLCIGGALTHQEAHAAGFDADPRSHIVAVADEARIDEHRRGLNAALAELYGVPYIEGVEDALALPGVDIVSICADVERRHRVDIVCARAEIFYTWTSRWHRTESELNRSLMRSQSRVRFRRCTRLYIRHGRRQRKSVWNRVD